MRAPHHVYTICKHIFASSTKRIFLIPHRTKNHHEAKKMTHDILISFHKSIHSENIFKIPLIHGLMISELQELLQNVIAEAGYIYNQECFIGIDFGHNSRGEKTYVVDEYIRDASTDEVLTYMTQFVRFYNPLMIINPFLDEDEYGYGEIERVCAESTLIGKNYKKDLIQTTLTQVHITDSVSLNEMKEMHKWLSLRQNKVIVYTSNSDATQIEKITHELAPDFIESPFHEHIADRYV